MDDAGNVDEFRYRAERSNPRIETLGRTCEQDGTVPVDENHYASVPAQNSTFNVSSSTLEVLKREFKRGKIVTGKVLIGEAKWMDVWSDVQFFAKYKTYLQLIITADNEEDFKKWEGWVGSRLKNLVQGVETFSEGAMMAHPGVKKFHDPEKDKEVHCNVFFGLFPNPARPPGQR